MFHLSYGALEKIHQGVDISDPLLQVLGHKAIPGGGPNRVRLHLSDGLFSTSTTVLAPSSITCSTTTAWISSLLSRSPSWCATKCLPSPTSWSFSYWRWWLSPQVHKSAARLGTLWSWSLLTRSLLFLELPVPTAIATTTHLSWDLVVQPGHELTQYLLNIVVL